MKYKLQKINNEITELSARNPKKQRSLSDPEDKPYYDSFNFTKMLSMKTGMEDPETPQ
jgi:hypothetical protein